MIKKRRSKDGRERTTGMDGKEDAGVVSSKTNDSNTAHGKSQDAVRLDGGMSERMDGRNEGVVVERRTASKGDDGEQSGKYLAQSTFAVEYKSCNRARREYLRITFCAACGKVSSAARGQGQATCCTATDGRVL
jgi:hypothetical protein